MVDVPVMCSITRFGLRSPRFLVPALREYRRLAGAVQDPGAFGFLGSAFVVENPRTCYTISLWSQYPSFSANVPGHVAAARRMFGWLAFDPEHGPELCSTKWRLVTTTNNVHWPGVALPELVREAA